MKMYKKSDLTIIDGIIIDKDGNIITPNLCIVSQANRLETLKQQIEYLKDQPAAQPAPSLKGFERESERETLTFVTDTPAIDAKVDEAMAIMDEIDDMHSVEHANAMADDFAELIEFVSRDYVIDCDEMVKRFDTPTLGNVLELTKIDIANIIATACGMDVDRLHPAGE